MPVNAPGSASPYGSASGVPSPGVADGMPDADGEGGSGGEGEGWTAGGKMAEVIAAVSGHGWMGVLTGSASALSGMATCPSVTVDIAFIDASFDLFGAACSYIEPHYGLWTTLMQVAWGLLALGIFWRGVRG